MTCIEALGRWLANSVLIPYSSLILAWFFLHPTPLDFNPNFPSNQSRLQSSSLCPNPSQHNLFSYNSDVCTPIVISARPLLLLEALLTPGPVPIHPLLIPFHATPEIHFWFSSLFQSLVVWDTDPRSLPDFPAYSPESATETLLWGS